MAWRAAAAAARLQLRQCCAGALGSAAVAASARSAPLAGGARALRTGPTGLPSWSCASLAASASGQAFHASAWHGEKETEEKRALPVSEAMLRQAAMVELRAKLGRLGQKQAGVSLPKLRDIVQQALPESSPEEVEVVCEALNRAGVVMRIGESIYLKPERVVRASLSELPSCDHPGGNASELKRLQREKRRLDASVEKSTRRTLWLGFGATISVQALIFRLTYYELAWDVMEPVAYLTGLSVACCTYIFFMLRGAEFSEEEWARLTRLRRREKVYDRSPEFDYERYKVLKRLIKGV